MKKNQIVVKKLVNCLIEENNRRTDEVIALENKLDGEIRELRQRLDENVAETKRAVNKSNYNEQYSRKTNFKITGIHEDEREK